MADFNLIRTRLLELHKALITAERVVYENQHGRVSANQFWQALTVDPSLTWLAPLNAAIVRLDELMDAHKKGEPEGAGLPEQIAAVAALLELDGRGDAFGKRYAQLVHADPDITYAHAALHSALGG